MTIPNMFLPDDAMGPFADAGPTPPIMPSTGPFTMSAAPATPTPMAPPAGPYAPPQPARKQNWGNILQMAIPAIVSTFAGRNNPQVTGAAIAGFMRGIDKRRAQTEHEQETAQRRADDAAKFRLQIGQELARAQTPEQLDALVAMLGPVAEVHGLDITSIADEIKGPIAAAKTKRDAGAVLEANDKAHPGGNWSAPDPSGAKDPQAGQVIMRSREWFAQQAGKSSYLPPPERVDVPNTSEETFYATFAKEHGVKSFGDLSTELQREARKAWQTTNGAGAPNAGSFEDYIGRYAKARNKKPEDLTDVEIEDARKRYNQSDDRPREDNGAGDYRSFLMTEKLQQQWDKLTAPIRTMRQQYGLMQAGLDRFRSGDKNGGSQAVLVTFQKILDPTSVVRESEYARTTDGQSFLNRIQGYVTRLAAGGTTLNDAEMDEMVETARQMLISAQNYAAGQKARMQQTGAEFGVRPELIFDDALTPPAKRAKPGTAAGGSVATGGGAPAPPKIGERRMFNGKQGEWDGKGWKPVQ